MTEKDYSGANTAKIGKNAKTIGSSSKQDLASQNKVNTKILKQKEQTEDSDKSSIEDYKKAGKIAEQVKAYAKNLIKPNMLLSEIAEKIEAEIVKLGGKVAFPVNLSIDDIAAHYTPTLRDEARATGLLKADIGVHVNGFICDIALSIDLSEDKKYSKLIKASEDALKQALELVKEKKDKTKLKEIGKIIQQTIEKEGFSPIVNLSGHGLNEFDIHSGLTIPNYDNHNEEELGEGAFAIEPFATYSKGSGAIYESAGSNIYHITGNGQVRDSFTREVLEYLFEEKKTLPFSSRELERKFGTRALVAISNLKRAGAIEEFPQLVEKAHEPVSQTETSFIISDGKVEILCN